MEDSGKKQSNLVGNNININDLCKIDDIEVKLDTIELDRKNLNVTDTNIHCEMFANPEKLIDIDNKVLYPNFGNNTNNIDNKDNYVDTVDGVIPNINSYNVGNTSYHDNNNNDNNYNDTDNDYTKTYDNNSDSDKESEEDIKLKKLNMLRKLGELGQHGVQLSQRYNMNSDLKAMEYEYELHRSIRDKHNGIRWLNNCMINLCYGLELGNKFYNPFDFKLDGWANQMHKDQDDFYDVFSELHEKYMSGKSRLAPELLLIFMIGGSMFKHHFSQVGPGMILNQMGNLNNFDPSALDKVRQNSSFNNRLNEEHINATRDAQDLEMLRKRQNEFDNMSHRSERSIFLQQEIERKKREIDDYERELQLRSDTKSMYSGQQPTMKRPTFNRETRQANNINMSDAIRQQNIMQQQKNMQQREFNRVNINLNPELDKLIESKVSKDTYSLSDNSTQNVDIIDIFDNKSTKSGRSGKKRKRRIKVSTDF